MLISDFTPPLLDLSFPLFFPFVKQSPGLWRARLKKQKARAKPDRQPVSLGLESPMDVDPSVTIEHLEPDQSHGPVTSEAPNVTAALSRQTRILQRIPDAVAPEPSRAPLSKKVKEFFKLKPPTFDHADDPMEAKDWLIGIKRRLELVGCTDKEGLNIATFSSEA